jgi:hypothetical protein
MGLFSFGSKKKELKAVCPITKEPIDRGFGYLLTTAEVIASKRYWDLIMTEPETLSYTISHFKNQQAGTQMRSMIFEKYAAISKPWIVSDSIIGYFDIDKSRAKQLARNWWENEGNFAPDHTGPAAGNLDEKTFNDFKQYAILEAGRAKASA